jgi:hypothetical protein
LVGGKRGAVRLKATFYPQKKIQIKTTPSSAGLFCARDFQPFDMFPCRPHQIAARLGAAARRRQVVR